MADPYLTAIRKFNKAKIDYLVIGVSGINYYAKDSRQIIMTADYDIFLKPELRNVRESLLVMQSLEYAIVIGGRIRKSFSDKTVQGIIKKRSTIVCENPEHNLIELCLEVSGYLFEKLNQNAHFFKAGKDKIRVANLKDLLRMKMFANREKDRLFLRKYATILSE